jgi:hypothetical protein
MQFYIYGHFLWGMSFVICHMSRIILVMLELYYEMEPNLSSDFHFIIMHNVGNCKRVVSVEGQFVTNTELITAFTLT